MQAEHKHQIQQIEASIQDLSEHINVPKVMKRIGELEDIVQDPSLWEDAEKARVIMQEKSRLESSVNRLENMKKRVADAAEFIDLGEMEEDAETVKEGEEELLKLLKECERLEVERLLGGKADMNNAYLEIHAGAGGTESADWASMLLRMYLRWAERSGFKTSLIEENKGDEAGIKSATIHIQGEYAYGLGKTETGVHRLVRCSPFDSQNRRHTSFSSVFVYPEVDDNIDIEINPSDLRIDTYRASGAGGQHVNTTDSAVRITHVPTGVVVQCQQERSQHKNKDKAMKMLKARLYEEELRKQEAEKDEMEASKSDNGWGHQIRSYVLHPYRMVKDLRTAVETSNTDAVLDGDLDDFIQAALVKKVVDKKENA